MSEEANSRPLAFVIEDDEDAAEIIGQALQMAGFETEAINDGRLALERLAARVPSFVTLDMHLPHVSGVEILREIRKDERLAETRVMVVTADPRIVEGEVKKLSDLSLIKPTTFTQVRMLAERLLPQ